MVVRLHLKSLLQQILRLQIINKTLVHFGSIKHCLNYGRSKAFGAGIPQWELIATATGALDTLSDTSGTSVTPDGSGNIQIAGTTAQISVTAGLHKLTLALIGPYTPVTYTLDGVLYGNGASSIGATAAGTSGQLLQSAGGASSPPAWTTATYPTTTTAGSLVASTATNTVGQIADVAVGQLLASGGVGVIPAYTGSPSVSGSVTAGTGLVATTGGVTVTAGNLALNGAASHVAINASAPTTSAVGFVTLSGAATTTLTSSAITANSIILFSLKTLGTLSASAITYTTTGGSATITPTGSTDTSVYGYMIIN